MAKKRTKKRVVANYCREHPEHIEHLAEMLPGERYEWVLMKTAKGSEAAKASAVMKAVECIQLLNEITKLCATGSQYAEDIGSPKALAISMLIREISLLAGELRKLS